MDELENTTAPSESSQTCAVRLHLQALSRIHKPRETGSRPGAAGLRGGGIRENLLNGYGICIWGNGRVLELGKVPPYWSLTMVKFTLSELHLKEFTRGFCCCYFPPAMFYDCKSNSFLLPDSDTEYNCLISHLTLLLLTDIQVISGFLPS